MSWLTRLAASGVRAGSRVAKVDNTRPPRGGSANVYYSAAGVPMTPQWDGLTAIHNGYLQSMYVMRCARITAEKIASFPFRAGADPDKPADHNPAAPLAQLLGPARPGSLGGPNPQWSARSMWIWSIVQRLICGRMAWETVLAPGADRVSALWPLVAPFIQPIPSAGGVRYFDGYQYSLPTGYIEYVPNQLFYSWRPSQLDPKQPESVLEAAALPVSLQVALERYLWSLAKNGMVGRTLVVTPSFEEPAAEAAFRSQFLAEFTGFDNAGKTMFATLDDDDSAAGRTAASQAYARQSVQALKLDNSPSDAQALELLQDMRQVIREAFGTPKSKLADATDSTFANAEQDDRNWLLDTIIPLAREIQDDVNRDLAPRLGSDVGFFDFSAATALKPAAVFAPIAPDNAYKAGLITKNDWRGDVGLPEAADGDGYIADPGAPVSETPVPPQAEDAGNDNMPAGLTAGGRGTRAADTLIAAGLAVKALDTGRVLLLQRSLSDDDPAAGMWEFPGGHIEPGEDPLAAAVREWQEETGCSLPAGKVAGSWTSPNGVYRGFVYVVPSEESVCINLDREDRHVLNPDDPDGDQIEVVAWWNPATLPGMQALRPEARKGTDWSLLATATADLTPLERAAAGTARHPVATERLMEYWSHGEGAAKIRWGTDGDFDRCRRQLGKYVQRPDELAGLCANLHHRATGFWPGHAPTETHRDTLTEGSSAGLLLPKSPMPTAGPHVFTPSKANRRKCGVCGKGVTASLHLGTGVAALKSGMRHAGPEGHHHTPTGHLTGLASRTRRLIDQHATDAEHQMTAAMRDLFAKQAKSTASRLEGRRGQQMMRSAGLRANGQPTDPTEPQPDGTEPPALDVAQVFDLAHWIEQTRQAVDPVFAVVAGRNTQRLAKDLHPGVPVYPQAVQAAEGALAGRASKLADTVSQTTYQDIARALAEGVANGEGISALAKRIRAVFDDASQSRAETIARTEVMSAINSAQDAYANALPAGVVAAKQWLATPDSRTRETHREANGQQRDVGQPFMVGGFPMQHPGDPTAPPDEVINCRCTTLYVPARAAMPAAAAA